MPTLASVLRSHQYSVTRARSLIFDAFAAHQPLNIKELEAKLAGQIDRASIYRSLELFEQLGIVKRLQIGWKHKFELGEIFLDHHHHASCIRCGNVFQFDEDQLIETRINLLAKAMDFDLTEHSLELKGICTRCKAKV